MILKFLLSKYSIFTFTSLSVEPPDVPGHVAGGDMAIAELADGLGASGWLA